MKRNTRIALVTVLFSLLAWGTVLVFLAFDRHSHSASDTLRPFFITMFPVWVVAIAGSRWFVRAGARAS